MLDGVAAPASVDRCGDGYVIGAGTAVLVVDGTGNETRIDGFGDAQGVAAIGSQVLVADAARHELVIVDTSSGRRDVVVSGAPVGSPVDGAVVPAALAAITADGAGGYLVGCNGDGSIRRPRRRRDRRHLVGERLQVEVVAPQDDAPVGPTSNTPATGSEIDASPMRNRSVRSFITTLPVHVWRWVSNSMASTPCIIEPRNVIRASRPRFLPIGTLSYSRSSATSSPAPA